MKRATRTLIGIVTAAVLFAGACSKSVEGENQRWDTFSTQVDRLAATYPGFRPAIEARKAAAKKQHDAAATLPDDQKIAQLSAANATLMEGFVNDLDFIDDEMKKLRESRVEVAANTSEDTRLGAKVAAEDAQRALDRVEAALQTGATDEAAANALLQKLRTDLGTAQSALDKVLAIDQSKQTKAADAKQSEASKKAADEAAAAAKVAPWKCSYCSSENPHDATSCNSCGAPKADAKADAKAGTPAK
ncbi:MAG TPA: hypothetical protein VGB85_08015 [Nannocystis sp.]|jgi:flagellar biosynthesis chaperone FliJ